MLEAFHKLKHAEGFTPSNYRARTNDETCIGCGLCVKRCPGKVSVVNLELCVGCGVCAYKCPTESLTLERREVTENPPKDAREYTKLVMADFAAARNRRGQGRTKS